MKRFEILLVEPTLSASCIFSVDGDCNEPADLAYLKCKLGCDVSQNGRIWAIKEIIPQVVMLPLTELKELFKSEKHLRFKRKYRALLKVVAIEYKKRGLTNREIATEFQTNGIKMLSGKSEWNLCSVFRLTNANIIGAVEANDEISNKP